MPIEHVYAGGQIAGAVGNILPAIITGDPTGTWLEGFRRGQLYDANRQTPNVPIPLGDILSVYYAGGCTWPEAQSALLSLGILTAADVRGLPTGALWSKAIDVRQPRVPLDVALRQSALGVPFRDGLDDTIRRYGYRNAKDRDCLRTDSAPLDTGLLLQLWWRGVINDDDLTKYLAHAGYRNDAIIALLKRTRRTFSVQEAIQLYWRGVYQWRDVIFAANFSGMTDADDQLKLEQLRYQLPGPGIALQWSQANAWDDGYAGKLGLDQEKPGELEFILAGSGQSWGAADAGPNNWPHPGRTPGDYYWRSHWQRLDPQTAYTLFHRLRPTGGPGGGPRVPGVAPFTLEDLTRVLQVNATPPGYRDQLRAISYSIPQRLIAKRMLAAGVVDRAEVVEIYQDQGYSPGNAERLTKLAESEIATSQLTKLSPITRSQVVTAYKTGIITRDQAAASLLLASQTDPAKLGLYVTFPTSQQARLAYENPFIVLALNTIDSDVASELATKAIEVFHKAYTRGELSADQARNGLISLGIVFTRATQYVQLWTYEVAAEGVEASAAKLVEWYVAHLLTQDQLVQRLLGLHYSTTDASLIVAAANIKLSEQAQKLIAAQQRAKQLEARQLAAAAKALATQQRALQKAMCSSGTRAQVAKWAATQLIGYPEAYARLQQCGMTSEDAISLLATASKLDKESGRAKIEALIAAPVPATTGNGQATATTP
jgi:hypothetical protein